jgi:hypothetical protein
VNLETVILSVARLAVASRHSEGVRLPAPEESGTQAVREILPGFSFEGTLRMTYHHGRHSEGVRFPAPEESGTQAVREILPGFSFEETLGMTYHHGPSF